MLSRSRITPVKEQKTKVIEIDVFTNDMEDEPQKKFQEKESCTTTEEEDGEITECIEEQSFNGLMHGIFKNAANKWIDDKAEEILDKILSQHVMQPLKKKRRL